MRRSMKTGQREIYNQVRALQKACLMQRSQLDHIQKHLPQNLPKLQPEQPPNQENQHGPPQDVMSDARNVSSARANQKSENHFNVDLIRTFSAPR